MKKHILFLSSLTLLLLIMYSCKLITEPDEVVPEEDFVTINGAVLDSLTKAPLFNVSVNIAFGDSKAGPLFTDSTGRFSAKIQITENTTININALLEGYIERNDSKKIIQGRSSVDLDAIYLLSSSAEEITLSGSVKDSLSLSSLDGAQVDFVVADSTIGSVFTNSSGLYSFGVLTVENFDAIIDVNLEGYANKKSPASVKLGKSSVNVDDILLVPTNRETISVTGKVLHSLSFAPIENAIITIFRGARELGNTFSDSNGDFAFDVLAASNFDISIIAKLEGFSQQTQTANIALGRPQVVVPNFNLTPLATETVNVFGKVVDSLTLSPLENVDIIFTSNNNTIATALTNSNGEFSRSIIIESNLDVQVTAQLSSYNSKTVNTTLEFGKSSLKIPDYFLLPETAEDVVVSGKVFDGALFTPLENVIIRLQKDGQTIATKFTDTNGNYSFEFIASQNFEVSVLAELESYFSTSEKVFITLGRGTIEVPDIFLNPVDPGGEQKSIEPASVFLFSQSASSVGVKESGAIETAQIEFEVQDSSGIPLDFEHQSTVYFEILNGPGGGEFLFPDSIKTNAQGHAAVSFSSGTLAGTAQVIAFIPFKGDTIKSRPVLIAINGGFPDKNHFTITPDVHNIPGLLFDNFEDVITVIVGDKFSNPVREGTSVYFNTTGGVIGAETQTNENGVGSVILRTGNPHPTHPIRGFGHVDVVAHTINENSQDIADTTFVLFTGAPVISNVTPQTFDIPNGGSQTITYTVTDAFANPVAARSNFSVEVTVGGATISGDIGFEHGDYLFPGGGATNFSFTIFDPDDTDPDPPQAVTIVIEVDVFGFKTNFSIGGIVD